MIDLAIGISGLPVKPEGSKRMWVNLSTRTSQRHAVLQRERDRRGEGVHRDREIVEPSLAIVMKISPGWPSSYSPTVM